MSKVTVDSQLLKDAMFAIRKLQGSVGIDLTDEDGYGETYFKIEEALEDE